MRRVAAEAGVGAATAYTYFSSKEHLVAEVFWRRLAGSPPAPHDSDDRATRVIDVLQHIALLVADEPEFAGAVTSALLGKDPDVEVLRQRIGGDIRDRLAAALGPETDPDVIDSLEMLYSGALVRAGMGYASYAADRAAAWRSRRASCWGRRQPEDRPRRGDGGLDDAPHVLAVLDEKRRQLAQSAEQDQRQRAGDRLESARPGSPG